MLALLVFVKGHLLNEVFSLAVIFKVTIFNYNGPIKETKTFLYTKYFLTIFINCMSTYMYSCTLMYDSDKL